MPAALCRPSTLQAKSLCVCAHTCYCLGTVWLATVDHKVGMDKACDNNP